MQLKKELLTRFPGISLLVVACVVSCYSSAATVDVIKPSPPGADGTDYAVYGQGRLLCSDYLASWQQARAGSYLQLNYFRQWMAGYMSNYNFSHLGGSNAIAAPGDERRIENQLESYCREHPEQRFAVAAEAIVQLLRDRQ